MVFSWLDNSNGWSLEHGGKKTRLNNGEKEMPLETEGRPGYIPLDERFQVFLVAEGA